MFFFVGDFVDDCGCYVLVDDWFVVFVDCVVECFGFDVVGCFFVGDFEYCVELFGGFFLVFYGVVGYVGCVVVV